MDPRRKLSNKIKDGLREVKSRHDKDTMMWKLLFDKLIRVSETPIVVVDPRGHAVFANDRYLSDIGKGLSEITGRKWADVSFPEEYRSIAARAVEDLRTSGKMCWFNAALAAAPGGSGEVLTWTGITLRERKSVFFMFMRMDAGTVREKDPAPCRTGDVREQAVLKALVDMLCEAADKCDHCTCKHARRVMRIAEDLSREIGLDEDRVEKLKIAALLHDLGKLAVDQDILFKKDKLTQSEFEEIKKHLEWGYEALRLFYFMEDIVPVMSHHHENYDGKGYPHGVSGEDIPMEARILTVADIYEALTSDRPYREAFSVEDAVAIMEYEKGHKLDPRVTDVFLKMVEEGRIGEGENA